MAGKTKNFLNYSAANAFVIALGLTSMQDWIAYAKNQDSQGRVRPDNIPSNPWTVYKDELLEMTPPQKFKINTFIGCKLKRKARTGTKDGVVKTRTLKVRTKIQDTPVVPDVSLTPFEIAKAAIQACNLPNREAFYEMKRKDMLPVGVPRKPEDTFKSDWKGWGDFLGNVKTNTATTVTF